MQTIIMMAEYGGNCFWHSKNDISWKLYLTTKGAIPIEDLPLSWELNNQLIEWVEFYEHNKTIFHEYLLLVENFDILGRHLWQLVKEELAGKYNVVYFSELKQKVLE